MQASQEESSSFHPALWGAVPWSLGRFPGWGLRRIAPSRVAGCLRRIWAPAAAAWWPAPRGPSSAPPSPLPPPPPPPPLTPPLPRPPHPPPGPQQPRLGEHPAAQRARTLCLWPPCAGPSAGATRGRRRQRGRAVMEKRERGAGRASPPPPSPSPPSPPSLTAAHPTPSLIVHLISRAMPTYQTLSLSSGSQHRAPASLIWFTTLDSEIEELKYQNREQS
ncbi:uncharacterized protein [Marmota flaviventris]|uniref:uncharacterized protein n=1 Tax=Marmota flaviventris TaxID=93162 RepID=UPI003A84956A